MVAELMGWMKILGSVVSFLGFFMAFAAWFVRRMIDQYDSKIKSLNDKVYSLECALANTNTDTAVLKEGKVGKEELKVELNKVELTIKEQREELKEDMKGLGNKVDSGFRDITNLLTQRH